MEEPSELQQHHHPDEPYCFTVNNKSRISNQWVKPRGGMIPL